ncbi:EscU/YscU/HrcU family type III secretion system export apparatus switch protein [Helicobacter sp. T3_23-1056]
MQKNFHQHSQNLSSTKAAALAYNQTQDIAPKVLASGKGEVAKKIIQKAKEFEIPLFANEELVNMLLEVEVDECIPVELYSAVVEAFVWLYNIEQKSQISQNQ